MKKDYYKILNIPRLASKQEIKKSFRQLSKKYHPDLNPNDAKSEEKFKEIQEAYAVLSNPQKKENYDLKFDLPEPAPYREYPTDDPEYNAAYEKMYAEEPPISTYWKKIAGLSFVVFVFPLIVLFFIKNIVKAEFPTDEGIQFTNELTNYLEKSENGNSTLFLDDVFLPNSDELNNRQLLVSLSEILNRSDRLKAYIMANFPDTNAKEHRKKLGKVKSFLESYGVQSYKIDTQIDNNLVESNRLKVVFVLI